MGIYFEIRRDDGMFVSGDSGVSLSHKESDACWFLARYAAQQFIAGLDSPERWEIVEVVDDPLT